MTRKLINPVETENALYEVVFGQHFLPNQEIAEGIDGLIVETGQIRRDSAWAADLADRVQTSSLILQCHAQGIPVYAADIRSPDSWKPAEPTRFDERFKADGQRFDAIEVLHDLDRLAAYFEVLTHGEAYTRLTDDARRAVQILMDAKAEIENPDEMETEEIFNDLLAMVTKKGIQSLERVKRNLEILLSGRSIPYDDEISDWQKESNSPFVVFRNAILVHKAEEAIAPYLAEKLGRKPHIMVLYGAAHMGIVDCLRDPELRANYLRDMYVFGIEGISRGDLYGVSEAVPVQEHNPILPEGWTESVIGTDWPFIEGA